MAQNSGFFDAIETGGVYDRTYSSADFCDNLATVIKNGVNYTLDDDLKVLAAAGTMGLLVARGRAWINGHYFFNDTVDESLIISTAPTGTYSRIDRVVLRLDISTAVRSIYLAIVKGTAAAEPTAPALTRNDVIFELGIATVTIPAGATEITDAMITDTRADNLVCGWAASVSPAVMSLLRQYEWNTTLAAQTNTVTFNVPVFRDDQPMIVDVYTNGIYDVPGVDYTRNGAVITFTEPRLAGTEISVIVQKSIDGTGLADVNDEIQQLQEDVNRLNADVEYIYKCNGSTDNVEISRICQTFLASNTDNKRLKIRVVGQNIGITAANSGAGSSASPYCWFTIGQSSTRNRKVIIDFTNAGEINVPIAAGTYNTIFSGADAFIIGAVVSAIQTGANTSVKAFDGTGIIRAQECIFNIDTSAGSYISTAGTFENCKAIVKVASASAYCFAPAAGKVITVVGGEYLAYTADAVTYHSAPFYCWFDNAAMLVNGAFAPIVAVSGYTQKWLGSMSAGKSVFNNVVSTLTINGTALTNVNQIALNATGNY